MSVPVDVVTKDSGAGTRVQMAGALMHGAESAGRDQLDGERCTVLNS